jgi:hypothetical protein
LRLIRGASGTPEARVLAVGARLTRVVERSDMVCGVRMDGGLMMMGCTTM